MDLTDGACWMRNKRRGVQGKPEFPRQKKPRASWGSSGFKSDRWWSVYSMSAGKFSARTKNFSGTRLRTCSQARHATCIHRGLHPSFRLTPAHLISARPGSPLLSGFPSHLLDQLLASTSSSCLEVTAAQLGPLLMIIPQRPWHFIRVICWCPTSALIRSALGSYAPAFFVVLQRA